MKKILIIAVTLCLLFGTAGSVTLTASATASEGLNIQAKSAVLMDYDTGTIVFSQNEKEHLPIASMVKIMTLLLVMEDLDNGRLSVNDMICVSENAASMGGSQAFLDPHADYEVDELIKSIVVSSANDSCVALAEHIAGSVESFVLKMNEKAASLGMHDTCFVNCTGLPGAEQYCCAHDAALMFRALIQHKHFFAYSNIWMFDFKHPSGRITQLSNTNKLIRAYEGCDGGKTGFTNEAKYCLSATAKRGNTRLISVVCGAETSKIRNAQNAALFNYGFANYETRQVVTTTPLSEEFSVGNGKTKSIKVIPAEDKFVFLKKGENPAFEYQVDVKRINAPVTQGDIVGTLTVKSGNNDLCRVNLLSDRSVEKCTYIDMVDEFIANW